MHKSGIICILLTTIIILQIGIQSAYACKDIIVMDDATSGDFNLFLKVRDPSRPGYQVLTIVPKGYQYTYQHPWTGKDMDFKVEHKFFGVASEGDTIPGIIKAGMCLTDAGLAFGDADTVSNWKNPTKNAWDDFDWIRYSCQSADDEDEAVYLLTEEAVKNLHATGVPENLFVVGPEKGYVIEADVIHYDVKEIDDFVVMSNYAKNLWRKSLIYRAVAPTFDASFEGSVRKGRIIRLGIGSIFGIRITDIGSDFIEVKQVPIQFGKDNIIGTQFDLLGKTRIQIGSADKVGFYRIRLNDIDGNKADVTVCFEYKEWEERMNNIIQNKIGEISVHDLMNWSRLHSKDLDGLRGMCDENVAFLYEGNLITKIPHENYNLISQGWFSANHPCVSIYVPFHICDNDIYDPYENGDSAKLSLTLLDSYGHDYFSDLFHSVERVFLNELESLNTKIIEIVENNENISDFLTISDTSMQKQAYIIQNICLNAFEESYTDEEVKNIILIWNETYLQTLENIKDFLIHETDYDELSEYLIDLSYSIVETRIDLCNSLDISCIDAVEKYNKAKYQIDNNDFEKGILSLIFSYELSTSLLLNEVLPIAKSGTEKNSNPIPGFSFILIFAGLFVGLFLFNKKN